MMVKLNWNDDYFKRASTWFNIFEVVIATIVELLTFMPDHLGAGYIALRLIMAVIQAIKFDINKGEPVDDYQSENYRDTNN